MVGGGLGLGKVRSAGMRTGGVYGAGTRPDVVEDMFDDEEEVMVDKVDKDVE